jgi:aryl-alcohol dehydrogenase-like predicted oxidoreductase
VGYRNLGRSGLKVSPLALGTMNFGALAGVTICDESTAVRLVEEFLDAGHNLVDTADKYNGGQAEEIVGRAVKAKRDSVVLAGKAGQAQGSGPNQRGLSRGHLTRALEASLRRLGTDHLDLYQFHLPDPDTPIDETIAAVDDFVRAGKVRYAGCCNFTAAQVVEAQWAAERTRSRPLISLQSQYSLVAREVETEVLDVAGRHGLGFLAWSPLGVGVLAGRYRRGEDAPADSRLGRVTAMSRKLGAHWATTLLAERKWRIAAETAAVAGELDTTPAAVAVAWLLRRPGLTAAIAGPRTPGHLRDYLAGAALDLPAEHLTRLDAVSAPEP